MRNRRVVVSRMLALVLPAALGLSCIERDWSVCSPQDQCQTGYTCTTDWKCVREVDGGSDGPLAVDSQAADTSAAAVDGPVSERDAPGDSATPDAPAPDAATPDTAMPYSADAATADAPTPDVAADTATPDAANLDSAMHDAASPDTAAPDAITPDVSVADVVPTCPTGTRDCNGTCIDQTGCCQASDCTGSCKTCTSHACVAAISQDSPTCAGTCDSTGTCTSKKGQLCTAVPGGCAAGTKCSPDGICCDRACSGSCEACDLAGSVGTCTTLPSGDTPHSGHTACGGTGVCAGSCGGSIDGSCTYPTVACGSASCSGLSYQAVGACNGGTCTTPDPQTCLYACSTTAGCTGECTYGSKRCNGSQPQTCDASGAWQNTGNACSGCATCSAGACASGACPASDQCHSPGTCNTSTGICTNPTLDNNTQCNDGNACTQSDSCQNGTCVGTPMTCPAPTACHVTGTCSAGTCSTPTAADGTIDAKCPTSAPRCLSGSCVQCLSDQNCTGSTPSCDPSTHQCVCRRPSATNFVHNPGFDSSSLLASWSQINDPGDVTWSDEDSEGCLGSGSAAGDNTEGDPSQCVQVPGGGTYYFGVKFKMPIYANTSYCEVSFLTTTDCSGITSTGYARIGPTSGTWAGPGWAPFSAAVPAAAGTQSAFIQCAILTTKLDQFYLNKNDNSF